MYQDMLNLLPSPRSTPDYQSLMELFPILKELSKVPQDPYYHAEGNVWPHVPMTCEELVNHADYAKACVEERFVLFYAMLNHDNAKLACTRQEDDGRITSKGHSKRGSIDVRIDLWRKGVPFELREQIANIVAVHQVPFFAFDQKPKPDSNYPVRTPEFLAHQLSWQMPLHLLITVARADMLGRHFVDKQKCLDDIDLFAELAMEEKCLYARKEFPSEATRMKYFSSQGAISPDYEFFHEFGSEVIVLSGLPASGKNTWIQKNAGDWEELSFDEAKKELDLDESDNVGKAVHQVVNRAKELLRAKEPFVWNATHLSSQMRNKTLDLLFRYNARVRLVYLEAPEKEIKSRNTHRDTTLSNKKIDEMLFRWEVPTPIEAHEVSYYPLHGCAPSAKVRQKT